MLDFKHGCLGCRERRDAEGAEKDKTENGSAHRRIFSALSASLRSLRRERLIFPRAKGFQNDPNTFAFCL